MNSQSRLPEPIVSLLEQWPLFDSAIVRHGFTPYMRDYDVELVAMAAVPDGSRSYREGQYRFRFTHCVCADVQTSVRDDVWPNSWSDEFIDYSEWQRRGEPEGYVWGVNDMAAYPGARYLAESERAGKWWTRLGQPMHEVRIETNAHNINLVFHRVVIEKVAAGDPVTGSLTPIAPVSIVPHAT